MENNKKAEPGTTGWLADKLDEYQELGNFGVCGLVLAVSDGSEIVYSNFANKALRLSRMNELILAGGRPVGWIGVTMGGKVRVWALPNYKDNPQVEAYLEEVRRVSLTALLEMNSIADVHIC
jgi:hypothetical protein